MSTELLQCADFSCATGWIGEQGGVVATGPGWGWLVKSPSYAGFAGLRQESLPTVAGRRYAVSTIAQEYGGSHELEAWVDDGSGSLELLAATTVAGGWQSWIAGHFTATGPDAKVRFRSKSQTNDEGHLLDEASVADVSMITRALDAAVLADLGDINSANEIVAGGGEYFATDVAKVTEDPVGPSERRYPSLALWPGEGGEAELETLTNRKGVAMQRYRVKAAVRAASVSALRDAMADLLDDVRNAIERSGSNLLGVSAANVREATVTNWEDPSLTSSDVGNATLEQDLVLTVLYQYTRGSA